jgi:erythromycin esterase
MKSRSLSAVLLAAFALSACGGASSPPPKPDPAWIADAQVRAHPLASISIDATDDSDLAFLDEVLAGRKIVELGENSHGVGDYSRAKVRLVKYLHERLGFDVLVFESSILGAYLANRDADQPQAAASTLVEEGVPTIWHTEDLVDLMTYVKSTRGTARPLIIAGMDMSYTGEDEAARRPAILREVVAKIDPSYADEVEAMDKALAQSRWGAWRTVSLSQEQADWLWNHGEEVRRFYQGLSDFLGAHMAELEAAYASEPLYPRVVRQAALLTTLYSYYNPEFGSHRDLAMADTFELIATDLYPGRKYMVWAHDSHLYKTGERITGPRASNLGPHDTGQFIAERHGTDVYMLSLLMYQGPTVLADRSPWTVLPAGDWSIEGLLHAAGASVAFLDIAGAAPAPERSWMDQEFVFRDWGVNDLHGVPREQMDGVLFFDAVDAPTFIDP